MLLSILLPTYNREEQLMRQLEFIIKEMEQNDKQIELIVSNNGSDDGTESLLKSMGLNRTDIRVYNQSENIGIINNFHFLINKSKGKYIWILGDDDVLIYGILNKIVDILINKKPTHIFMNFSIMENGVVKTDYKSKLEEHYYLNGMDMFTNLVEEGGFGSQMFISANIFLSSMIKECNKVLIEKGEEDNLALPLGYSLYCSQGTGYLISNVYIQDEYANISWSERSTLVFCRDIISICDILGEYTNCNKVINHLLINNLPMELPEFYYMINKKKYRKNNYALKWMIKKHKSQLIKDLLTLSILIIKRICEKGIEN